MPDKENVLILDRISDFNSVISFYEETAELICKMVSKKETKEV